MLNYIFVGPKYTSQTCSQCGNVDKGNRNGIAFECTACGYEANADLNAAVNILNRFHQERQISFVNIVPDMTKTENKIINFR